MVGKNNHTKMIQSNLKERYKSYKVGRRWVFASIASLSLGAALFLGSATTSFAETTDTAATPDTQNDSRAMSATAATNAKTVTLKPATQQTDKPAVGTSSSTANVTASDGNGSNQTASKNGATVTKQAATVKAAPTQQQPAPKTDAGTVAQPVKASKSNPGNNGSDVTPNNSKQAEVPVAKRASNTVKDATNVGAEPNTGAQTNTQPAAQSSQLKTAQVASVAAKVDRTKADQLDAQAKTLLVDPSNTDLDQAKTVAAQQYALTGKPQQIVAVVAATQPSVTLTASTTTIGYGQPAGNVEVNAIMTVNNGDVITFTFPTNLDDLHFESAQVLPTGSGTSTSKQNSDGTYTVTDTFAQSGVITQKITLSQRNNGDDVKLTPDQVGKDFTGNVTTTINNTPDTSATLTFTQKSNPSIAISSPTRVSPALTKVTDANGNVLKDDSGNPLTVGDTVVPNTNYVYKFTITDSKGIKNDSGDGIDKNLNTNGTTITIPVPTGFTLDGDLTNTLNGFTPTTATVKQDASGSNIIITVPANVKIGQGGIYLAGQYNNKLTDVAQTLTANGNPTITQTIPGGQTLTATSTPWTEKLSAQGTGNAPAIGKVNIQGNSGTASSKLTIDNDPSNDPKYIASYGYGVTSSTPVSGAKITLTIPDGVDATGIKLPDANVDKGGAGAAYLPGTTSYSYTMTLVDGTTETGTVAAGGTINKKSTTSTVKQIVLQPNYLAAGATTGSNSIHLLGKVDPKYTDGSAVENGDGLKFQIDIQVPGDDFIRSAKTTETIVSPQGRVQYYYYQGSKVPGEQNAGYLAVESNGYGQGQTTDLIFEPILYFVLPAENSVSQFRITAKDASKNVISLVDSQGNLNPNAGKLTYYTTSTGQTGIKIDYTGTGLSVDTSDTGNAQIQLSNNADALPVTSYAYLFIDTPTTPISSTTKISDLTAPSTSTSTLSDGKTPTDLSFTDGDANALIPIDNKKTWIIDTASATVTQSMAKGNQNPAATNKGGKSDARGDSELDFYTNLVNTAGAASNASIAVNLPTAGDDQGSTYTFELNGPITVPTSYTTATGTGDPMTSTVLYSTSRYTQTGNAPDTTGYVSADQVTDWTKIRSVIVKVGNVPTNTSTGRIKFSGTAQNFVEQSGKIGYLQTTMYANGSAASITPQATSIAITSTSTINARMHYKDDTGDHYIALTDLTKKLTDNKDKLNASDFPSTADKFTAADTALIPQGYHLVADPNDGSKLEVSIVNSDHGDYGINEPNDTAAFGVTSKYYFDGDIIQYELSNKEDLTVTYVDTDNNNQVVGTPETIQGQANQTGTYTVTVPTNYVLVTGQPSTVDYTITPGNGDNITIKLGHEHTTALVNTKRTFTYTGLPDNKKVTTPAQTVTWTTDTDKVTGVITYTPSGDYAEVTVPTVAGYTPDKQTVPVGTNTATPNKPGDNTVTVNYTADPQKLTVHYIDVTGLDKTSGWTASDGTEVTSAEQTLNGTTDQAYTNTIKIPEKYVQVAADAGASRGTYDNDDKTDQSYYVYIKHATKTITPTTDPKNDQLKTTITRTINYVYGPDAIDGKKGTTAAPTVTQTQDFTRTGTVDLVTGDVTYSDWTLTSGPGEGFTAVTSPTGTSVTALTGYTPDQSSVVAVATTSLTAGDQPVTVTVTYHPDVQKVTVHYIDVNGSTKTSDWTADDGTEVQTAAQALSGTTDEAYTNTIKIPENYVQVAADAGASSGTYDNDDKTDQNYNVYIKHATKTITPATDPKNDQLKATITRTINYVYGNDTVDHRKGDQAFNSVEQRQDYTRTGTVDEVTGKVVAYTAWTLTTGDGEGFNAVTSGTITGYTPDKTSVGQTTVNVTDVANKALTPVTVTYKPNAQKVEIHYIDVTTSTKKSGWTTTDGTEVTSAMQTLDGTTDGVYTNPLTLPMNYVKVGQDTGAVSGFFDNNGQVTQTYNVYIKHGTKTITPTNDPKNDQLKATITRTINYVYGNDTVDHRKGDQAFNPVEQHQDFTRTGTVDEVTGNITYTAWTPTTGNGEGLGAVTSDLLTGYTPDQASVGQAAVNLKDVTSKALTPVTVTYKPNAQAVQIHYIDVTGSTKTSGWVPTDGTEVTSSKQTLNGTTDGVYTNPITLPANYVKVGQNTGAASGFFDKDSKTDQNYNVYIKHATKTITPTNDPKNDQLRAIITRTINYVYGNDTTDHRKGDQTFNPVNQHQDYTRTGIIDEVTGTITYSDWTPTAGPGEGLGAVTSSTLTGYTPDQTSVGQAVVGQADVANKALTPVTVTYNPNSATMTVTYVDDVENGKVVEGTVLDGTVDQSGHFNVIVPNGYELNKNQKSSIDYKFTPNEAQNKIIIHLVHGIAHTTTTTTRTINYYIQGTRTPVHAATVQTLTWNVSTDKVTGESVATPQGGYDKVTSPLVSGYTADVTGINGQYPKPVTGKSGGNLTATVYYTAVPVGPDNGGGITPPTGPETTNTTDGGTVVPNQPQNEKVPQQPNGKATDHDRTPNQPGSNGGQTPMQSNDGTAMNIAENAKADAAGQLGQSVSTQTSAKAQSVTSQRMSHAASSGSATAKLPQTNEQRTSVWSALGISLMSMMSLLGFAKRKKHDKD